MLKWRNHNIFPQWHQWLARSSNEQWILIANLSDRKDTTWPRTSDNSMCSHLHTILTKAKRRGNTELKKATLWFTRNQHNIDLYCVFNQKLQWVFSYFIESFCFLFCFHLTFQCTYDYSRQYLLIFTQMHLQSLVKVHHLDIT